MITAAIQRIYTKEHYTRVARDSDSLSQEIGQTEKRLPKRV